MRLGPGFFRPESRPSRDLGVLLARRLGAQVPLRVLDLMAGCGIRALRYGLEAGATQVWANDADPDRRALIAANLMPLVGRARLSTTTAQQLLADCLQHQRRFELVDLDAFGCPSALLPLAIEAVAFGGVLYLASTDGRSPTGHDRRAAIRSLGAAARAHPASWELALRLQLASQARVAWSQGRGLEPVLAFSDGRTFRTAVRITRAPAPGAEEQLGLLAHCPACGDQQVQPLLTLRPWRACLCRAAALPPLAISGPLWIGPLQDPALLQVMATDLVPPEAAAATIRLLTRLQADPAPVARCWPTALIARRLGGGGPPRLDALVEAVQRAGGRAWRSGVMAGQIRSDASWPLLLDLAARLCDRHC
ncbi:MAG: N2,N2-dimethylguanosine tRNA methyltransferase [Cyanobacteriota bacterium]